MPAAGAAGAGTVTEMESTHVPDLSKIAIYLGLDVGKGEHHAVALTPAGRTASIRAVGIEHVTELLRCNAPRMAERLAREIFTALEEQTVVVPGTDAAAPPAPTTAGRSAKATGTTRPCSA
jgi:hypothetical protein